MALYKYAYNICECLLLYGELHGREKGGGHVTNLAGHRWNVINIMRI